MTPRHGLGIVVFIAFAGRAPVAAQGSVSAGDRIRSLVARGDSAAARALADSIASSTPTGSNEHAEGLYWRGALARAARDGRVDLTRVAVDHPTSPVAADALYRLAQLDLAAGDREGARRQLARAYEAYAGGTSGGDAAFEFGQLLIAEGSAREGCAALDSGIARTPADQVEKRNRMSYARRPCERLPADTPADSQPTPKRDSASTTGRGAPTSAGRAAAPRKGWSVQVGAFASKDEAEKTAAKLKGRGYDSRVTSEKPFRVRIGHFTTRAEAAALMAKLKSEKTTAILVESE